MRFLRLSLIYASLAAVVVALITAGVVYILTQDGLAPIYFALATSAMSLLLVWLSLGLILTRRTRKPGLDPEAVMRARSDEKIIHQSPAVWMYRLRPHAGHLVLSTHRLVFIPHDQHGRAFNITLDNVRSVRRFRLLYLIKLGINVQRHDRESENIVLLDEPIWHEKINHARRARRPVWVNSGTLTPP